MPVTSQLLLPCRLQLVPNLQGNFTTEGAVSIVLTVKDSTRKIAFHLNDIELDEDSINLKNMKTGTTLKIVSKEHDPKNQMYVITTEDILNQNEEFILEIKFTGHLNDYMQGFYRSSYISRNETK